MKLYYLLFICIINTVCSYAQVTAKLSGKILDEKGNAVDGASTSLLKIKDSALVKLAFSDKNGLLEFENIKPGNYFISVTHVKYKKYTSQGIIVTDKSITVPIADIVLTEAATAMDEVVVNAKKPFIERKADRMIVNVENSIASAGSSALEILERSPGVVVNQDNAINLKGKAGVVIMIDGKPSPLSGTDVINYLKGVPAANIQSIEIITNPSAKYDAAGNAGIINIKFKKDQRQGMNGNFSLSLGQGRYFRPTAGVNFNYRNKKWNLFGSQSYFQPVNYTMFYINRKFFDADKEVVSVFDQTSHIKQPTISSTTRFGADYYMGKKTVLGIMFNVNQNSSDRDGVTNSIISFPDGQVDYYSGTNIGSDEKRFNGFGNFNIKHSIDSTGQELTVDIDFGKFNASTFQDIVTNNFNRNNVLLNSSKLETDQDGLIEVRSAKADYVLPLSKSARMEAGAKMSWVNTDAEVNFYDIVNNNRELDQGRSNHFLYKENVNAAYAIITKEFEKSDIKAGLRMEHTNTNGIQLTGGESFSRSYVNFFPSIAINRKLKEQHQLSLSYSKRIDRPGYRQLNPFRIFVDPYTYVVGDPALKPVLTDAFELSHTFKGRYVTTLGYSKSKDVITDIFVQDDSSKISYQVPANLQDFYITSLGAFIPVNFKKWMNGSISGNMYLNKYVSPLQGGTMVNDYFSWDVRLNSTYKLGNKGWAAELNGSYQAKNAWGLFVIRSIAQVSGGVQKSFKDNRSVLKLSVTDFFKTNRVAVLVAYQNMDFFTNRTWDSQIATISFTHRFGKNTIQRARQRTSGVEDEKRRAA